MRLRIAATLLSLLAGCASQPPSLVLPGRDIAGQEADVLLLGEQHDALSHQELQLQVIETLAARGRLAAVALEMAEQGGSTAGLVPNASEADVRAALRWDDSAWPWPRYRTMVMAAVAASVPVLGANLPRSQMGAAMADAGLDALLPPAALEAQQQAIRLGHCNLLPEPRIRPMARVQIARDRAMAQTLAQAVVPGRTVVLAAGAGHVDEALGVPQHLPTGLRNRSVTLPAEAAQTDPCQRLRRQLQPASEGATR